MNNEKYIPTFIAIKDIAGIVNKGDTINKVQFLAKYPYIDLDNKEYFKEIYGEKFSVGNVVKYKYKPDTRFTIKEMCISLSKDSRMIIDYTISDEKGNTQTANESNLTLVNDKWIVSFKGNLENTYGFTKPSVHLLDYFVWESKIKDTWCSAFVFDTFQQAEKVSNFFADHSIEDIMKMCENYKN